MSTVFPLLIIFVLSIAIGYFVRAGRNLLVLVAFGALMGLGWWPFVASAYGMTFYPPDPLTTGILVFFAVVCCAVVTFIGVGVGGRIGDRMRGR